MASNKCACEKESKETLQTDRFLYTGQDADNFFGERFNHNLGRGGFECPWCQGLMISNGNGSFTVYILADTAWRP